MNFYILLRSKFHEEKQTNSSRAELNFKRVRLANYEFDVVV